MEQITRHSMPTKLDHAPFGSECKVPVVGDEYELWVQYSRTEEDPKWELMGKYHELETK